jgi:hypothetical protein
MSGEGSIRRVDNNATWSSSTLSDMVSTLDFPPPPDVNREPGALIVTHSDPIRDHASPDNSAADHERLTYVRSGPGVYLVYSVLGNGTS